MIQSERGCTEEKYGASKEEYIIRKGKSRVLTSRFLIAVQLPGREEILHHVFLTTHVVQYINMSVALVDGIKLATIRYRIQKPTYSGVESYLAQRSYSRAIYPSPIW